MTGRSRVRRWGVRTVQILGIVCLSDHPRTVVTGSWSIAPAPDAGGGNTAVRTAAKRQVATGAGSVPAAQAASLVNPSPPYEYRKLCHWRLAQSAAVADRTVSVIIPVKNGGSTIARTVHSLLNQSYRGAVEVILVGDAGDSTWTAVERDIARGLVTIVETSVHTGGRDSNHKRNLGLEAAAGDVLCLTDSDMVLRYQWLETGVALLDEGWACAAGGMASVNPGFWGSYVDENPFAAKTPRMEADYVANAETLGRKGVKPPITANVFFTRAVYELVGGLDAAFVHCVKMFQVELGTSPKPAGKRTDQR